MKTLTIAICTFLICCAAVTAGYSCAAIGGSINDEDVVIVWDQQTHTEHFIRNATFDHVKGGNVGFIVPTPTPPQLAEADDVVFSRLSFVTAPKVITRTNWKIALHSWLFPKWSMTLDLLPFTTTEANSAADVAGAADSVAVVSHQRIGDLDAITLRATDAAALNNWLSKHHYRAPLKTPLSSCPT